MFLLKTDRSNLQRDDEKAAIAAFHAESRARIAKLAAEGKGRQALAESVRLLGIDLKNGERPRLVGYNGRRLHGR